ncbi:MAG: hypothetical protein CMQ40_00485 [Gammaproteobacteria bacterium]|nr:hypothetical protein [Gammaproteobacteria bacterium]|tara:strand:- start:58 stop:276 length:219 start_codon:yes stop_codon:yes gene_type:complete
MASNPDQPCKVCKQIRYFLLVAVPLLLLIGTRPDVGVPSFPIEMAFTNMILLGFFAVLAWRIYTDYFKNRKK